ncbi:MAG TPA: sigma 54-interacting transcriptional regulator [Terriglobales bacterium]|nr:sigma 54-interacting transcriptional regulator [Terriglobales bacterium]
MSAKLIGILGPLRGVNLPLSGELSVGRESSNQLWTCDPALSRRHCQIDLEGGSFAIRDLGSRNGTLVNGVPVQQRQVLQHRDEICVGDSILLFLAQDGTSSVESSAVELTETIELAGDTILLREQESIYLQADPAGERSTVSKNARDLHLLLKIATDIGGIRDRESLEWQLLGMVLDLVPADRGAILQFEADGQEFSSAVGWDRVRGPQYPVRVSRSVVRSIMRERAGLLSNHTKIDQFRPDSDSSSDPPVYSLLCVPLQASQEIVGAIYLDSQNPAHRFEQRHLELITAVAAMASLALHNLRQLEELEEENRDLRRQVLVEHNMIGAGPRMQEVYEFIRRVAPSHSTVLLEGESGTGKEMVARAIHRNSPRAERPFVAVNCAAITETLLESELFGHEKGAFTGAGERKKGKVEAADGGTLFLDEIGELAPALQAKLLRVLQEREVERVGGTKPVRVDVRFIAATNRCLADAVHAGGFRADLYYRLNVIALTMPSLRDRREDIPALAEYFVTRASRVSGARPKRLSAEARQCLLDYDWPGNVRELENAIEHAMILGSTDTIAPDDLPEAITEAGVVPSATLASFHEAVKERKRQVILHALQQANGNYLEAARSLHLHPNSLLRLIRTLDLKAACKAGKDPPGKS